MSKTPYRMQRDIDFDPVTRLFRPAGPVRQVWELGKRTVQHPVLEALNAFFMLQQGRSGVFALGELPEVVRHGIVRDEDVTRRARFVTAMLTANHFEANLFELGPCRLVEVVQ